MVVVGVPVPHFARQGPNGREVARFGSMHGVKDSPRLRKHPAPLHPGSYFCRLPVLVIIWNRTGVSLCVHINLCVYMCMHACAYAQVQQSPVSVAVGCPALSPAPEPPYSFSWLPTALWAGGFVVSEGRVMAVAPVLRSDPVLGHTGGMMGGITALPPPCQASTREPCPSQNLRLLQWLRGGTLSPGPVLEAPKRVRGKPGLEGSQWPG